MILRMLLCRGWFLAVEVTLLAVGIVAAILSLAAARASLSTTLRVPKPSLTYFVGFGSDQLPSADYSTILTWTERRDIFSRISLFSVWSPLVVETGSKSIGVEGAWVTSGMTSFLPRLADQGRPFVDSDFSWPGSNVLASHRLLKRVDASVGTTIQTSQGVFRIVGVFPAWARFPYPIQPDLIIPTSLSPSAQGTYTVLGELRPGLTQQQAERALNDSSQEQSLRVHQPVKLVPIQASLDPGTVSVSRYGLALGTLTLVLLVATASLVELLHAIRRRKECSVKLALGCTKLRLAFERALDVLIICTFAAAISGVAVAASGRWLAGVWSADWVSVPRVDAVTVGWLGALLFFCCLTISVVPALVARSTQAFAALKEERASTGKAVQRLRTAIITLQVAVSIAFGLGAARLVNELHALASEPLGIVVANVWDGSLDMQPYHTQLRTSKGEQDSQNLARAVEQQAPAIREQLRLRLQSLPGVAEVAFSSEGPASAKHNGRASGLAPRGVTPSAANSAYQIPLTFVDSDYLHLLDCRLVAGRYFTPAELLQPPDMDGGSLILSEPLARKLFGEVSPVGKNVEYLRTRVPLHGKVVGVVTGMKTFGLNEPTAAEVFYPLAYPPNHFALKMKGSAAISLSEVQEVVSEVLPGTRIEGFGSLRQRFDTELAVPRQRLSLLAFFATISAAVAAFGLASVLLVVIKERDLEIGIRRALGASDLDLAWALLRQILPWVGLGLTVGCAFPALFPVPLGIDLSSGATAAGGWSVILASASMLVLIAASLWVPLRRAFCRPINDLLRSE